MKIRLQCPACSTIMEGPDTEDSAVQTIPCPRCGGDVPLAATTSKAEKPDRSKPVPDIKPIQFRGGRRKVLEGELDMTPMVDVTFLLLIFFMVTAAFSLQRSFNVPAPENNEPSAEQQMEQILENHIIVRIDSYNTFRVITEDWDEEAPSKQELMVRLREAQRGDSKGAAPDKMLVMAHGDALHENVVTALDAGASLKMKEVKLVTVEEDD